MWGIFIIHYESTENHFKLQKNYKRWNTYSVTLKENRNKIMSMTQLVNEGSHKNDPKFEGFISKYYQLIFHVD